MRKDRRYHHNRKKSRMNFATVIVIILVAVIMGIMTAKLVIYFVNLPDIGQDGNTSTGTITGSAFTTSEDAVSLPDNGAVSEGRTEPDSAQVQIIEDKLVSGYYIQYGSFSSTEAANALVSELNSSGITAQIVEKSGTYKVVGELFAQKSAAQKALEDVDKNKYKDVFITMI